jgi:hypothetical protein
MDALKLEIIPIRAADDPPLRSKVYQEELHALAEALKSEGFTVGATIELIEAAGGNSQDMATYLGLIVQLAHSPLAGVVATAVGAWLHARYGRKVRLKIGDIEAEAQTEKQLRSLLKQAEDYQSRNKKAIHEP